MPAKNRIIFADKGDDGDFANLKEFNALLFVRLRMRRIK